jgi:hypothetical protein
VRPRGARRPADCQAWTCCSRRLVRYYADLAGPEFTAKYQTLIYLAGSASAEFIADIALCPFEAVKASLIPSSGAAVPPPLTPGRRR